MDILSELENYINEFNQMYNIELHIDSIRIEFSKQHKKERLDHLGTWSKINANDRRIMAKLKKRLAADEVTSAYQLEKQNIYYYNSNADKPKYRKAIMVIFGMKQYHKAAPPKAMISNILSILKNVSNIDICYDMKQVPNLAKLSNHFALKRYVDPKLKVLTDTYYINDTYIDTIEKITIYNKAKKNALKGILWRIEAKVLIANHKCLLLPLSEFKSIINLLR